MSKLYVLIFFLNVFSLVFSQVELKNLESRFFELHKEIVQNGNWELKNEAGKVLSEIYSYVIEENDKNSYAYAKINYLLGVHFYYHIGNIDSSIGYWIESKTLLSSKFNNSEVYCSLLSDIAFVNQRAGNVLESENYYLESLRLFEKNKFEPKIEKFLCDHDYFDVLSKLSNFYLSIDKIDYAEKIIYKAEKYQNRIFTQINNQYAEILLDFGRLNIAKGEFINAIDYILKSIQINDSLWGRKHLKYIECLSLLGEVYVQIGDYQKGKETFINLLKLYEESIGYQHFTKGYYLGSLGVTCKKNGQLKEALSYYEEALEVISVQLGSNSPDCALLHLNIGNIYYELNNIDLAEKSYNSAQKIYKDFYGMKSSYYSDCLQALSYIYMTKGDSDKAKKNLEMNLEIKKEIFGEYHIEYAKSLNDIAIFFQYTNNFKLSIDYFEKCSEIYLKILGPKHPEYAIFQRELADLYVKTGKIKDALKLYSQSLSTLYDNLGGEHFETINSEYQMGKLFNFLGNFDSTLTAFKSVYHFKMKQVNEVFSWLSTEEKKSYWQQEKDFYDNMNTFSVSAVDSVPSSTELSYDANLISKSLLLETSRELDQAIAQSSDEEMKAQFTEMKQLRKLYSKMQSEGSTNKEILERYKTQADSLDKILVNKLGEYAASKRKFEITWKDVQSNLTTTDAAIEFARYYDDKDSLYKYMALVVRPDYKYPKLVVLGEEEQIRGALGSKDFAALYGLVWQGIDSLLTRVKTVYYSPASELNNVAFSALCSNVSDGQFAANSNQSNRGVVIQSAKVSTQACNSVLMDRYALHQLTTTRYLADVNLKKDQTLQPTLTLLGGINFDEVPEYKQAEDKEQSNEDFALQTNLDQMVSRSSSSFGREMPFLEGSKEEVTNIAGLMTSSNWQVQTKSDKRAGEYEFKKELETKAPGVLHIATHGFAFPDEAKKESKLLDMNQTSTYKVSEDPMVRCGLMLGGSNISWTGNPQKMIEQTGDDGILTAAEVANLDLSNTKLVVLSACETGLGKIEGSEGTFGLKRGFKLAGVEQIIVSLWSVPDKETMELMTLFYSDLTKTLNPVVSFSNAQKEMRNKYPTDPEKWAGFVLVR